MSGCPTGEGTRRLELPVTYTGDVAYHREKWSVLSEVSHGYMANQFRAGLQYRFGAVELRGAGRYYDGSWYPSTGVGVNLTRNFGVDVGPLRHQDLPRTKPHLGLAISFRIDKR